MVLTELDDVGPAFEQTDILPVVEQKGGKKQRTDSLAQAIGRLSQPIEDCLHCNGAGLFQEFA